MPTDSILEMAQRAHDVYNTVMSRAGVATAYRTITRVIDKGDRSPEADTINTLINAALHLSGHPAFGRDNLINACTKIAADAPAALGAVDWYLKQFIRARNGG